MITLHVTEEQLAWIAQAFADAGTDVKCDIDPEADFEQQLDDLGAFDGIPGWEAA